ncbi:MAG TPA: tRNA pseudouridine(55) synthase TruB, partial [Polyangiaceae bacterium]|nr:tRNA pseudouridine(55) synthase TruB [Polyangiaceae bacterium]
MASGVLVLDKPRGPTSHDVVARIRRAIGAREVGHAGTLDPMATGVLVVAVGEATKLVPWLMAEDKAYEATIALGIETDTLDADGREVRSLPPGDELRSALASSGVG